MAYMCNKHYDKECDGCGECHEKHYCYICEEELTDENNTYQVETEFYCEECLKDRFRV